MSVHDTSAGAPDPHEFRIDESRSRAAAEKMHESVEPQLFPAGTIEGLQFVNKSKFKELLGEQQMHARDKKEDFKKSREGRAIQMSVDSGELMNSMRPSEDAVAMKPLVTKIEVTGSTDPIDLQVDFTKPFWKRLNVSEDEIIKALKGKKFDDLGLIDILGTGPRNFSSTTYTFNDEQAKNLAQICRTRYLRQTFAAGHTSEINIQYALALLRDAPDLRSALVGHHDHGDEVDKLKKKMTLSILVTEDLGRIESKAYEEDYEVSQKELRKINQDINNATASGYSYRSAKFKTIMRAANGAEGEALNTSNPDTFERRMEKAEVVRDKFSEAVDYYHNLSQILNAIVVKGGDSVMAVPSLRRLFDITVTPPVLKQKELNKNVNLIVLKRELAEALELEAPEKYAQKLKDHKQHEKEASEYKPEGSHAVVEIYKAKYLREGFAEDEATRLACEDFFMRELNGDENTIIESVTEEVSGGELSTLGAIRQGLTSILRLPLQGSDESFIVSVAEGKGINIPRGSGNTNRSKSSLLFNGLARVGYVGAPILAALGATPIGIGSAIVGGAAYAGIRALTTYSDAGLERAIGNRRLGVLWPKWGARPAWGKLEHRPAQLHMAWNALLEGARENQQTGEKRLNNTWYVQGQMKEVARMLLPIIAQEAGYDLYKRSLKTGDWKAFNSTNKREIVMRRIVDVLRNGFTSENAGAGVVSGAKTLVKDVQQKAGLVGRTNGWLKDWLTKRK